MSGEALQARIYECGYNMSTFARAMDVTPSAVHKWVRNGYPTGRHLKRVLELLHPDLETAGRDERLEAVEQELSLLRDQVADVARLLAQLVRQQTDGAGADSATPTEQARLRSRP